MSHHPSASDHIVIIGASHGGISMAEQLRKQGFKGRITMLDREDTAPMERPPLSKAWLAAKGAGGEGSFLMRQAEWFEENKVEFRQGADAIAGDVSAKTITLQSGEVLAWDHLILATGATPRALPVMDEAAAPRVHVLRVPTDAENLSAAMTEARSIAIVGGGYIGLEVAASARKRGLDVTVVEMAPRLLARVASPEASQYFHALHEDNGTRIMVATSVMAVEAQDDHINIAVNQDGKTDEVIKADLVVAGIGVIPDMGLAESLGLELGNGIKVDGHYRSSVDGIWAIGDVALSRDGYTQGAMRIESVHHAQMSAEICSAALMGDEPKDHEVPWFWSEQYDKKLQSAGFVPQDAEVVKRLGKREGAVSFWSFDQGVLKSVEAIGDGQAYMLGKTALSNGDGVTPDQIADPDFDLKSLMKR